MMEACGGVDVMSEQVSERVGECMRRARECEDRARDVNDPQSRDDFRHIARCWHRLAESYQFADHVDQFLGEIGATKVHGLLRRLVS
jgi:hypothetical protein